MQSLEKAELHPQDESSNLWSCLIISKAYLRLQKLNNKHYSILQFPLSLQAPLNLLGPMLEYSEQCSQSLELAAELSVSPDKGRRDL